LYVASITKHNVTMPVGSSESKVFEQDKAQFTYKLKAELNFANWPTENCEP